MKIAWIGISSLALLAACAGQAPAPRLTLAQLQQAALSHNPTLRQAASGIAAAAGRAAQAGLWPNPTVGYEGAEIRGGSYRGGEQGFFVQQNIVLGHKLRANQLTGLAAVQVQKVNASERRQAVLTAVQIAFYDALTAQQMVTLRQTLLAIAQDAARTTHQLGNVGQANQSDILEAEVEAERAQTELTSAQDELQRAWAQLAAVVGEPSLPAQPLAGDLASTPPPIEAQAYLQRLLTESPEVSAAMAAIARDEAALRAARKVPIPDLQLRAGVESNREINEASGQPVGWQGFASAGIELPIFNRNQGNVKAASAELASAQADLTRIRLALRKQSAPVLADYQSSRAAAERYRTEMLPKAKQAYQLYSADYQHMAAAYPQVLIAQRTWFQLQADYLATLDRLWRSASLLQGYLLSEGLARPTTAGGTQ